MNILIYKAGRGVCNAKQILCFWLLQHFFFSRVFFGKYATVNGCTSVCVCVFVCVCASLVVFSVTQCCQVAMQMQDCHGVIRL